MVIETVHEREHPDVFQKAESNGIEKRLFERAQGTPPEGDLPSSGDYARGRTDYVRSGGGSPPPGATPIDEPPPTNPQ